MINFQREKPEGLPLTNDKSKSKQQQLREERQKEYNDFLKQKQVLSTLFYCLLHSLQCCILLLKDLSSVFKSYFPHH